MTKRKENPFYNNCKFLRYIYPKTSNINAWQVVAWCEKFNLNIYKIRNKSGEKVIMCCVTNSPYIVKSNCNGFRSKEKTTQTRLFKIEDWMEVF